MRDSPGPEAAVQAVSCSGLLEFELSETVSCHSPSCPSLALKHRAVSCLTGVFETCVVNSQSLSCARRADLDLLDS